MTYSATNFVKHTDKGDFTIEKTQGYGGRTYYVVGPDGAVLWSYQILGIRQQIAERYDVTHRWVKENVL